MTQHAGWLSFELAMVVPETTEPKLSLSVDHPVMGDTQVGEPGEFP